MADINLGMIPERWIQDIGDVGPRGKKDRNPLKIENVKEIPKSHPLARLDAYRDSNKFEELALQAILFLRRHQIEKIVLDDLEKKSETYGDLINASCDLSAEDIQKQVDDLNFSVNSGDSPIENDATKEDDKRKKELGYIDRFKVKAYLLYNKREKRSEKLMRVNHDIDYHKELLHNHLFHNYNISSILCGRIKPEDGYKGLFPDPIDYKYVQLYNKQMAEEKEDKASYIYNIRIENLVKTPIVLKKESIVTNDKQEVKKEELKAEPEIQSEQQKSETIIKKEQPKVEPVVQEEQPKVESVVQEELPKTQTIIQEEQSKLEPAVKEENIVEIPSVYDVVIPTENNTEDKVKKPLKVSVTKVKPSYVNSSNDTTEKIDILKMISDDVKNKYTNNEKKEKIK